jgi:hypothetical protein
MSGAVGQHFPPSAAGERLHSKREPARRDGKCPAGGARGLSRASPFDVTEFTPVTANDIARYVDKNDSGTKLGGEEARGIEMTKLIAPVAEDFYENGLFNLLQLLPRNLDEDERLIIESVVYNGYGYFRTYSNLERLLEQNTTDIGELAQNHALQRDAFSYAWSLVDTAYALHCLSKLRVARGVFELSPETLTWIEQGSNLRNYMDHLSSNFRNFTRALKFAPLFGMMSFQFTPLMRDAAANPKLIYVNYLSSTHIRDSYDIQYGNNWSRQYQPPCSRQRPS